MPKPPPNFIDKVNYIVDFWEDPCGAPWTIYAEMAIPVLGNAIMNLVSFDQGDVVRGLFHPKYPDGSRSSKHGRRRRHSGEKGINLAEAGNDIGKKAKVDNVFFSNSDSKGLRHLWQIDDLGQRGFFYWMIADLTLEGVYQWSTLVQKSTYCSKSNGGTVSYKVDSQGILGILGWQGITMGGATIIGPTQYWNANPAALQGDPGAWTCMFWATFFNTGSIPIAVQLGFTNQDAPEGDPVATSDLTIVNPLTTETAICKYDAAPGETLFFRGRTLGGNAEGFGWNIRAGLTSVNPS